MPPYSGVQPPSCANGDGDPGTSPRINDTQAAKAASTYCAQLISDGIVLSASGASVNAYTVKGVAENNAAMSLDVLFDISSCPTNKVNSTVDFKSLGLDECFANFYTTLADVCEQDHTWEDYNPDFTMEGGVFANDCGLWSIGANG